ncbi:phage tail protein [Thermomonas hydrothermalis]|uniref:phage tail protein n=1 Tax=Thermomonas hydrothermalis TaxID=213588 RepID=UPI002353B700|nr:phage tail protein [Thermomonas hydrothermalis]
MPMMTLGTFVFSLPTLAYQQLQRQIAWRHATSDRVGARAAAQYLGVGEETIQLEGTVAKELTAGEPSLNMLRDLAEDGQPLPLVDGRGYVYGAYVIKAIGETQRTFFPDGAARELQFQLELLRVDEDALQQEAAG